jgi:hypothetical protein
MNQITIVKGPIFTMNFDKKLLKSIKATPDGVMFSLQNGMEIFNGDDRMPRHTKELIESTLNLLDKNSADIKFDLFDYNKPVSVTNL